MKQIKKYLRENNLTLKDDQIKPKFFCSLCKELLVETKITKCNCRFCRSCIEKHLTQINECPNCECEINDMASEVVNDFAFETKIRNLEITCPNRTCHTKTKIEQMPHHLSVCRNKEIACVLTPVGCQFKMTCTQDERKHHAEDLSRHFSMVLDAIEKVNEKIMGEDIDQKINEIVTENIEMKKRLMESEENIGKIKNENMELQTKRDKMEEDLRKTEESMTEQINILNNDVEEIKQNICGGKKDNTNNDEIKYIRQRLTQLTKTSRDNQANWKKLLADLLVQIDQNETRRQEMEKEFKLDIIELKKSIKSIGNVDRTIDEIEAKCQEKVEVRMKKLEKDFKQELENEKVKWSREINLKIDEKMDMFDVETSGSQYKFIFTDVQTKREKGVTSFQSDKFQIGGYRFIIQMNIFNDCINLSVSLVKGSNDKDLTWPMKKLMTFMVFNDGEGKSKENVVNFCQFSYNENDQIDKGNYDRPTKNSFRHINASKITGIRGSDLIQNEKVAVMLKME